MFAYMRCFMALQISGDEVSCPCRSHAPVTENILFC